MTSSRRSSRWSPAGLGLGLAVLGLVFLVYLLGLFTVFKFTSDPVAAGETYAWGSTGVAFVQPVDGDAQCVVHTSGSAARVTVHRLDSSLIPGELVDRPDGDPVSLTCDQPTRIATGTAAQLYPATGPTKAVYLFGALLVIGAGLWLVGRLTRGARQLTGEHSESPGSPGNPRR
jgi:hypothetical protein